MTKDIIGSNIDISWLDFLYRDDIMNILDNIDKIYDSKTSPSKKDILRFMKQDLLTAKYILYGQDPYPKNNGKMVATGRCFEPSGYDDWLKKTPDASLRNILRALYGYENNINNPDIRLIRKDIKNGNFKINNPTSFFDNLENQGIILLNYGLTVGEEPESHLQYWDEFQKELINYMVARNTNLKYIIWGDKVLELFKKASGWDKITLEEKVISDYHPVTNKFVTQNKTLKMTDDIVWY